MRRRAALIAIAVTPLAARADAAASIRAGGVAVLLRHGLTDPGVGDPPGFRLDECSTQRNLSDAGRQQSRRIGGWFKAQRLDPSKVRTSPWCRCVDTAQLAFGRADVWGPLASTFAEPQRRVAQAAALREALASLPGRGFEVWVTHQVNISALTGLPVAMGQAILVRGDRLAAGGIAVHNLGALSFE